MKEGKSELVLVVDRSGSMAACREEMEGSFRTFLKKQQSEPGECVVTYFQFDDQFEKVFESQPLAKVEEIRIEPRGLTALVDAIGRSVHEVGQRLAAMPEPERPGQVIFVIITDGMENHSREYTAEKVKEMVQHQEEKYAWRFLFLGANMDAVETGRKFGFSRDSSMTFEANEESICAVMETVGAFVCASRVQKTYQISKEEREQAARTRLA